uniref:Integrase catalytic domain-containing protein n=1 Tax=Amphimedon queenslandica TaxID=400682 RepID=A0A1X7UPQ9_AMPQE
MTRLKLKHHLVTAYHPQANGLDERFNQILQRMLVKFCSQTKESWDEYIDTCVYAYDTARHETSLFTPFEIMLEEKLFFLLTLMKIGVEVLKKDFRRQKRKGWKLDHSLSEGADNIVNRISHAHLKLYIPPRPSEEGSLVNPLFEEVRFIIYGTSWHIDTRLATQALSHILFKLCQYYEQDLTANASNMQVNNQSSITEKTSIPNVKNLAFRKREKLRSKNREGNVNSELIDLDSVAVAKTEDPPKWVYNLTIAAEKVLLNGE